MNAWPQQSRATMNAFYGNPDGGDGRADAAWMRAHLVRVKPPYRMQWSWGGAVAALTVHKACAPSLLRVLEAVARHFGSQRAIERARMHICGGAYNFRTIRDGSALSAHAWGAAIDFDPERNAQGRRYAPALGMTPLAVVELFAAEGWDWGGRWTRPDAMHFQAARTTATGEPDSGRAAARGRSAAQAALIAATFPG